MYYHSGAETHTHNGAQVTNNPLLHSLAQHNSQQQLLLLLLCELRDSS
jgi:hypothetical protein